MNSAQTETKEMNVINDENDGNSPFLTLNSHNENKFEGDFPFDKEKYQKILEDIMKNKKGEKNIKTKNNRKITQNSNEKSYKARLREKRMSYKPIESIRREENLRYVNLIKSSKNLSQSHSQKMLKVYLNISNRSVSVGDNKRNLNRNRSKERKRNAISNNKSANKKTTAINKKSKSKPKILLINIKEMMKDILTENKEKEETPEVVQNKIQENSNSDKKSPVPEEPVSVKDKIENILNYSGVLDLSGNRRNRTKSRSKSNETRNKKNIDKNNPKNKDFDNNITSSHDPALKHSNSVPNLKRIQHKSYINTPNSKSRHLSVNQFYLNSSTEFDYRKVYKPRIKFSYLWDLVHMCERRKKILAEKNLGEVIAKSGSRSRSRTNSAGRRDKVVKLVKSKARKTENKVKVEKNVPSLIKTQPVHVENNYLSNFYITRKNKMLEDILSKNTNQLMNSSYSSKKHSMDESVYRKNIEWLNAKNENKIKFEKKLKEEMKITDETERILRNFPVKNNTEDEFDVSSLVSEGLLSNNQMMINYEELIKELTKKVNLPGIINKGKRLDNPVVNNNDYLETIKSEAVKESPVNIDQNASNITYSDVNMSASTPYKRKSIVNSVNHQKYSSKTYNQRLKDLVNNSKNIETIILEKKQKFNIENEDLASKSKKMLEKYSRSGNNSHNSSNINIIQVNFNTDGNLIDTERSLINNNNI